MTTLDDVQKEMRKQLQLATQAGAVENIQELMARYWDRVFFMRDQCARFGNKRFGRYQLFIQGLVNCKTPAEAMRLYADATQTMVGDYNEFISNVTKPAGPNSSSPTAASDKD